MPIFTIVFERRNPAGNHDYQPLLRELQGHKCFPLWESAWLGSFENNATQVHNYFRRLLAEADRVVVCEMTNHFCYSGVVQGANHWLELNPPAGGVEGAQEPGAVAPREAPAKKAAPTPAAKRAPSKPPAQAGAESRRPAVKKAAAKAAASRPSAAKGGSKAPAGIAGKAQVRKKRGK
jgi:hypothetical protein